jgi:small subunit ribosomal protein S20
MPIKTSAKKYMRVTDRKTALNKTVKGVLKSTVRKAKEVASDKSKDVRTESFRKAQAAIDKAAKRGIIKKNTAARKKSRLNALMKKSGQ